MGRRPVIQTPSIAPVDVQGLPPVQIDVAQHACEPPAKTLHRRRAAPGGAGRQRNAHTRPTAAADMIGAQFCARSANVGAFG